MSTLGDDIARVFAAVLAICDAQGLIGREMFAIDGVKLPSNASKQRSGTRADFEQQAAKHESGGAARCSRGIARRTRAAGARPAAKEQRSASSGWSATRPQLRDVARRASRRIAAGRRARFGKSNRTDNESAKMATGKGVIQGYTGVAAVDARAPDHRRGASARHGVGAGTAAAAWSMRSQPLLARDDAASRRMRAITARRICRSSRRRTVEALIAGQRHAPT